MDYILESIFSSWLFGIIPLILLFLVTIKLFALAAQQEKFIYTVLCIFVLPVVSIVFCSFNEISWGYGHTNEIEGSANNEKWLCFVSEGNFHLSGSRGRSRDYNARLYVLDPKTGERICRDVIGDFVEVIELRGDTLLYRGGEGLYFIHNVNTRKRVAIIDYETLPKMFPELNAGVNSCKYDKYTGNINVTALTGKVFYLDPFSMKLSKENNNSGEGGHYNNDDIRSSTYDLKLSKDSAVELNRKDDGLLFEMVITNNTGKKSKKKIIADDLIEARIIGHSWKLKRLLVESYETTKKDNFIISCFSYEGELLWQVKQNALGADDFYTKGNCQGTRRYGGYTSTMDIHQVVGENLVISIQGFVFSVEINSGKINWKARL